MQEHLRKKIIDVCNEKIKKKQVANTYKK